MRGKKSDSVFVAQFIQDSVQNGFETPDRIVKYAKRLINQIDADIREVEIKKVKRSKLLDVIASFENIKKDKTEDAKLLPFFELEYPTVCKKICESIAEHNSVHYSSLISYFPDSNIKNMGMNFCIKQLLEVKIISRENDVLMSGERFKEYMTFVLHEAK